MEHKLVELAKSLFDKDPFTPFLKKQIHQAEIEKDRSGMICSGSQLVAFYYLNQEQISKISKCVHAYEENEQLLLELNEEGLFFKTPIEDLNQYQLENKDQSKWSYLEKITFKNKIHIIGGGHVGLALSQLMNLLGFYVVLYDDREDLNTIEKNSFAHRKVKIEYEKISEEVPEDSNDCVVLMSFGYRTDELCIQQLIHRNYKYFGVMGSQEKMNKLFNSLLDQGFSKEDINNIYSPIGLQIKSKTPMEIAVSIAAEIIFVKNEN